MLLTTVPPGQDDSGGIAIGEGVEGVDEEEASGLAPHTCTKTPGNIPDHLYFV